MALYYVNKNAQSNGDHEVHKSGCSFMPDSDNRIYLGDFVFCSSAITEARKYFNDVDGCYYCTDCHTE